MTAPSKDDLTDLAHRVWAPALAGAVGAGGLSGYLSSKTKDPSETSGQRRMRILRNALAGTAMGGAAGAATEEGARALYKPFFGDSDKKPGMGDRALEGGLAMGARHGLGIGTGIAGGLGIGKYVKGKRNERLQQLFKAMPLDKDKKLRLPQRGEGSPDGMRDINSPDDLKASLLAQPENIKEVESRLASGHKQTMINTPKSILGRNPDAAQVAGIHGARDQINAAGFSNPEDPSFISLIKQILNHKPTAKPHVAFMPSARLSRDANMGMRGFLKEQGPVSGLVSKLVGAKPLRTGIGEHALDISKVPELYRRLVLPSVKGWVPPVAMAGALGAGVLGVDKLQKRLMGQ